MNALLEARNLSKSFPVARDSLGRVKQWTHAVMDVSLSVAPGQTLGIVGESGSGKSTVGRMLLRLIDAGGGSVHLAGGDITHARGAALREVRKRVRMIFQDPFGSLDPSMTIEQSIAEPLSVLLGMGGQAQRDCVVELLGRVGLNADYLPRRPTALSGGQLQRIAIARALSTNPSVIVCDEPVTALDMSVRAHVVNLLLDLQRRDGISYVFISHDLTLVENIADTVAVMYMGRIVEQGPTEAIFDDPKHPYTKALLASVPAINAGERKDRAAFLLHDSEAGGGGGGNACAYQKRCPLAFDRCRTERPLLGGPGPVKVACHLHQST